MRYLQKGTEVSLPEVDGKNEIATINKGGLKMLALPQRITKVNIRERHELTILSS